MRDGVDHLRLADQAQVEGGKQGQIRRQRGASRGRVCAKSLELEAETHDYCLRIFWQMCQDEGGSQNQEMHTLVNDALIDMMKDPHCKLARVLYLFKAIENIFACKSMVQSINVTN